MDWMSPMDASFLHIEGPNNPMHIGGVSIFEGPRRRSSGSRRWSRASSTRFPGTGRRSASSRSVSGGRCGSRIRISTSPTTCVTRALPAPGTEEMLRKTAARIFAQHLDRSKPLWEIWMIEGLSENRWALLSKVHHCMVDGVSATDLMTVMFEDLTAGASAAAVAARARAQRAWSWCCARSARQAINPSEQLRMVARGARRAATAPVARPGRRSAAGHAVGRAGCCGRWAAHR